MESKKRKLEYDKNYLDFPAIGMLKIRKRSKAAKIFKTLIRGEVVPESDYFWLVNNDFNNQQVRAIYYLNRANLAKQEWVDTKKPWNLVNAIADYRKAGKSRIAVDLVSNNFPFNFANGNSNLRSALLTTSGGAKRDLKMYDEAIQLGIQAHELTPKDYCPCTLIGACKMLLGDITQGHQWYQKAIKRGFNEDSFEQELRSIYNRATQKDKAKIKQTLIQDGWSYKWLK
jgi:tetratricopeptide (TPR) repeat protein